jgi:hypothetical protein
MRPLHILLATPIVLAAAAFAGVGQPDSARGQEPTSPARSITAAGVGTVTTVPDRAHFSFGVQAQSRTASQALEAAEAQLSRVVAALRAAGVAQADIQTDQLSLSPRTSEDGAQIVGYTAVSSVSVRVRNLDRAGPVVDAAVGAGANQVYGPSLTRSDQNALPQRPSGRVRGRAREGGGSCRGGRSHAGRDDLDGRGRSERSIATHRRRPCRRREGDRRAGHAGDPGVGERHVRDFVVGAVWPEE